MSFGSCKPVAICLDNIPPKKVQSNCAAPPSHTDDDGSYANEEAHLSKSFGSCKAVCLTAVCKNTTAVEIFSSALGSMLRKVLKVCIEVSPT